MTAQKSAFYDRTDKGQPGGRIFGWLVVDKIVDEVLEASVALNGKQMLSAGQSSGQIILKRSLDTIPSRKPNAEKSGRSIAGSGNSPK